MKLIPDCRSSRTHSLAVVARKSFLSRARKQAVKYANFCNLVLNLPAAAIVLLAGTPALAHRLDEYLQGTLISVEKDRVEAQVTLTPGVAVFPILIADIDVNADGAISETEQRAYAARVLRELSLTSDGIRLTPRLVSLRFPAMDEMKEGRGEIRLGFSAALPPGGGNRKLTLENRHESRISAYQVNCLVPHDPHIHISAQTRNYSQSIYQLDYVQTGAASVSGPVAWLVPIALLLSTRLVFLCAKPTSS